MFLVENEGQSKGKKGIRVLLIQSIQSLKP